jgi:hypothetical protein
LDGIDAFPDENAQARQHRNGAACLGLQHETGDAHSGRCRAGRLYGFDCRSNIHPRPCYRASCNGGAAALLVPLPTALPAFHRRYHSRFKFGDRCHLLKHKPPHRSLDLLGDYNSLDPVIRKSRQARTGIKNAICEGLDICIGARWLASASTGPAAQSDSMSKGDMSKDKMSKKKMAKSKSSTKIKKTDDKM